VTSPTYFSGVKTAQLQDLRPCLEMSIGLGLGVDVLRLVSYGTVIVNITGNYNFIKLFASFYQNCRVTLVTNPFHTMCVYVHYLVILRFYVHRISARRFTIGPYPNP